MEELFRLLADGPMSGDCTMPYFLRFNRENVTVEEFVEDVLSRDKWGEIEVIVECDGNTESHTISYSHGKAYGDYKNCEMQIKYASAHGGWGRMDYCLKVIWDDPKNVTKNATKKKTVKGVLFDGGKFYSEDITVRTKSDSYGKILSLSVDGVVMLQIALEQVADMLKLVEDEK